MDQQTALRNRNKGVELCAIVRDGWYSSRPPPPSTAYYSCPYDTLEDTLTLTPLIASTTEQERFRSHDPNLQAALDDTYEYMTKHLDPVLSKAIEEVLLYQPDQTADFLAHFLRGTLNPTQFTYVVRWKAYRSIISAWPGKGRPELTGPISAECQATAVL